MKIFIQDCGVYGCIVVVAEDEDSARIMMEDERNYQKDREIQFFPIQKGFIYCNLGDM